MKIGTQNQAFFPENILEKFRYIKEMGFDGFEIDGKLLVNNIEEVKAAIKETGLPVTTACGGYDGWIGDFIEERRLNGLKQIERILEALAEVGGKGIVVPAAWGMFTFRLPPMTSPRSLDGDRKMVSDSLRQHRICNLHKTGNVRALHVVGLLTFTTMLNTGMVDIQHDVMQTCVNFLGFPAQARSVLRHFKA